MIDVASSIDLSDELIRRYSEDCEMKGISPDTLRKYLSSIDIFNQYIKTKGVELLGVNKGSSERFSRLSKKRSSN